MKLPLSLPLIPNRRAAVAAHTQLTINGAPPYERGLFYRTLLTQQLWASQSALARSVGTSVSNLSRMLGLARIPREVVDALGGPKEITFRLGDILLAAIDDAGEGDIVDRAREARKIGYREPRDLLDYIVADRLPSERFDAIRVRLARDKKSLRVEMPNITRLLPHLPAIEDWLTSSFALFEVRLAVELKASALEAQQLRMTHDARKCGS